MIDPYPFNAVKRVWIDQNKKGHGSTKKSLTVHTVYFCCFLLLFNFLKIQLVLLQKVYCHEVANVHGHILCPHFLVVHKKVKSFLKKNSSFDFTLKVTEVNVSSNAPSLISSLSGENRFFCLFFTKNLEFCIRPLHTRSQ